MDSFLATGDSQIERDYALSRAAAPLGVLEEETVQRKRKFMQVEDAEVV